MARRTLVRMIVIILYAFVAISQAANTITVDQSGNGHYGKIQDAIDSVPSNNKDPLTISIKPGTYKESITIPPDKPFITLSGTTTEASDVMITWDQRGDIDKVATFHVLASNFVGRYITIQNTFGPGHQAVALRVSGDRIAFYDCSILGYQDTLFDEIGRHYYENCYIEGVVDFIFGSASSFFQNCHIHSPTRGYITAQRREASTDSGGFVFFKCQITGKGEKTFLGRPWVGSYARVIFAYTYMEDVIEPLGWSRYSDGSTEQELMTNSFCGQFKCDGPGATTSNRVKWAREFSEKQIANFLTTDFINGKDWIKSTPVTASPPPSPPPKKETPPLPPSVPDTPPPSPPPPMKPSAPPPTPVIPAPVIPSPPPQAPVVPTSPPPVIPLVSPPAPGVIPSSPPLAPVVILSPPAPAPVIPSSSPPTPAPVVIPSSPPPAPVVIPSSPPPAPVAIPSSPPSTPVDPWFPWFGPPAPVIPTLPPLVNPFPPPAPVAIPSSPPSTPVDPWFPWLAPPAPVIPTLPPPLVNPFSPPPVPVIPLLPPRVIPSAPPPAPVVILPPATPVISWFAPPSPPPPSPPRVIITPWSPPATYMDGRAQEGEPIIMYYHSSGASSIFKNCFSGIGTLALTSAVLLYLLA
ncbi:putative pectinesterase/pectinesterase inhibitor 28 [Rosa sericea]